MDSVVTSAWLISWYVDVLMIYLGKWSTLKIMYILLIFLSLLLLLLILSFLLMLMFSGGWLQAIVTHWSVPVRFEQLSCHHHKTLSKFLVQPPLPSEKKSLCTFALQNLHESHCQIFGGFPMVYFVHFWSQTFHIQRLSIWSTEFSLQKTRSLVNLSEWSALSILIHRALVTQSSPPKVLLDVSAFGIISIKELFVMLCMTQIEIVNRWGIESLITLCCWGWFNWYRVARFQHIWYQDIDVLIILGSFSSSILKVKLKDWKIKVIKWIIEIIWDLIKIWEKERVEALPASTQEIFCHSFQHQPCS